MRILFHHRIASRDGQAVHIEEMIAALQRQGHETILVGPSGFKATAFGGSNPLVDRIKRLIPGALYELLEIAYSVKAFLRLIMIKMGVTTRAGIVANILHNGAKQNNSRSGQRMDEDQANGSEMPGSSQQQRSSLPRVS